MLLAANQIVVLILSMLVSNLRHQCLVMCLGLTVVSVSHAALFDDTEARKRIIEVDARELANHEAQQNNINDLSKTQKSLEKRIQGLEALINGKGLLDIQNQLDSLKQEVAQLKGDLEVITHGLETLRVKQTESIADLEVRVRRLETGPVAAPANVGDNVLSADAKANEQVQLESRAFADAEALQQASKYKEAFAAFDGFLKAYGNSKKVPDALFAMGNCQYALKNYKSAINTQQKLIDGFSTHVLAPQAMFSIANSHIQLGQMVAAKKSLKDLIAIYPNAEVTPSAEKRLKVIESFK